VFLSTLVAFDSIAHALCTKSRKQSTGPSPRWRFFFEEVHIDRLLLDLATRHKPRTAAFEHATVFTMTANEPLLDYTVVRFNGNS
jgi:hypothetical protein